MGVQGGNIRLFEGGCEVEDVLDASGQLCNAEEDSGGYRGGTRGQWWRLRVW